MEDVGDGDVDCDCHLDVDGDDDGDHYDGNIDFFGDVDRDSF